MSRTSPLGHLRFGDAEELWIWNMALCRHCFVILSLAFLFVELSSASAASAPPLIALLLDTSGSIEAEDLGRVQAPTRDLLAGLSENCEITIYKFNDESQRILEKTSQVQQIDQAIGSLKREVRYTALYDALFDASQYLEDQPSRGKAILFMTDGKNEGGQTNLEDGLAIARKRRISVYTVGVGKSVNRRVLRRISEQTGGAYMDISAATSETLASSIQQAAGHGHVGSPASAAPATAAVRPVAGLPSRLDFPDPFHQAAPGRSQFGRPKSSLRTPRYPTSTAGASQRVSDIC